MSKKWLNIPDNHGFRPNSFTVPSTLGINVHSLKKIVHHTHILKFFPILKPLLYIPFWYFENYKSGLILRQTVASPKE